MSDEPTTEEEPEQTKPPRRGEGPADPAVEDRTSPFPYAEKFDEWVADETAPLDTWPPRPRRGAEGRAGRR